MQTITIPLPDNFTPERVEFIRNSALAQIETEIRNTITIPQEEIDRVEAEISQVREIIQPEPVVEEPLPVVPVEEQIV